MKLETLDDVLQAELADLYSAEKQLVEALPKVAEAASSDDLREAIEHHLQETRGHVDRLEQVFESLGTKPASEHCKAMEGLIAEGDHIIEATGSGEAKDVALIAAAQRVEHYEIAAYGTVRSLAEQLGRDDAASLLGDTLDEESAADEKLTEIATAGVNRHAAR
jgi:ferritin-like metal-binding protein YciE